MTAQPHIIDPLECKLEVAARGEMTGDDDTRDAAKSKCRKPPSSTIRNWSFPMKICIYLFNGQRVLILHEYDFT